MNSWERVCDPRGAMLEDIKHWVARYWKRKRAGEDVSILRPNLLRLIQSYKKVRDFERRNGVKTQTIKCKIEKS